MLKKLSVLNCYSPNLYVIYNCSFTKVKEILHENAPPKLFSTHCNFWHLNLTCVKSTSMHYTHWSISVKKWQKLFQVKMAPNFTKFEWYQQWKASQGLKNWLKAIKAIKATVQARYEKKMNFHNFFNWLWFFRPKNSCGALGLTKKVHKGQKGHYKARS